MQEPLGQNILEKRRGRHIQDISSPEALVYL